MLQMGLEWCTDKVFDFFDRVWEITDFPNDENKSSIDTSIQKVIKEVNDCKHKIWEQTMNIYFKNPSLLSFVSTQPKPTKWQRFKTWIKRKLK